MQWRVSWSVPLDASVGRRPRRAAADLVDVYREQDRALGDRIARAQRAGDEPLQQVEGAQVQAARADLGVEHREAAVHHDTLPLKQAVYLVHLEGAPRMVRERDELGAYPGAAEQVVVVVDVVDRLDVHAILERERQPSDVIPREQRARASLAQLVELRRMVGRVHGGSRTSGGT